MNRAEFEALGDKHKKYEGMNQQYFMPMLPIMVRLDGKAFHTFTKGLARPYDARMSHCMAVAAKAVLEITQGLIAYTQSDEITVIIPAQENMFYGGRRDKINSVLAAAASVAFNKAIAIHIPEKAHLDPVFDCRSWQYPTDDLCVESLLWRETDATRNSLTMACSAVYKQHELQHKGFVDQHNMLHEKGINWNNYPNFFKRGSYFAKRKFTKQIDEVTWNKIPLKNRPASNEFLRSEIVNLDLPPMSKIINMQHVVFDGQDYITETVNI